MLFQVKWKNYCVLPCVRWSVQAVTQHRCLRTGIVKAGNVTQSFGGSFPRNIAYKCKHCGRQFLEHYRPWQYSSDVKQLCINLYLNGMGLRGIERVTDIHHTTILHWVREAGLPLPDAPESEEIPEITDLDELQTSWATSATSYGFGLWSITLQRVSWHGRSVIAAHRHLNLCGWLSNVGSASFMWLMGGQSTLCLSRLETTFLVRLIWLVWKEKTQGLDITSQGLHRSCLCYSKSVEMLKCSLRLLLHYLKYWTVPLPA